jgi:transcriptional regulator with XRE-family HTH domain
VDINKSLDHFMREHGMSQMDLSREAHLNPATISLIRNGHREPRCSTLKSMADIFGVRVSEFIAAGEHG